MEAYDTATPLLRAAAVVYVTVRRNENKPLFRQDSYVANINTTYPQGLLIVQVNASDKDSLVTGVFIVIPAHCRLFYSSAVCRISSTLFSLAGMSLFNTIVSIDFKYRRRRRPWKQCMDNIKLLTKRQYHSAYGLPKTAVAGRNSSVM